MSSGGLQYYDIINALEFGKVYFSVLLLLECIYNAVSYD